MNRERNYLFDNLKCILIFLVVFIHFLGGNDKNILKVIWYSIYSFHMPLFIFISGYFTKYSEENKKKAIKNYLIPYIFFSVILYSFRILILKDEFDFRLLIPQYAMWFLLSIFTYKIIYNTIYNIKHLFIISIIMAVLVGFDTSFSNFGSFSRTVVFFPFFVAGNKFKEEYLIKSNKVKKIILIILPIILIGVGYLCTKWNIPKSLLKGDVAYKLIDISIMPSVITRITLLIISFILCYLILNVVPNKKIELISEIGQNTIIIYLLHIFVVLAWKKNEFFMIDYKFKLIISLLLTLIIIFISLLPMIKKVYNYIIDTLYGLLEKLKG